jgi:hypothetical protein
MAHAGYVGQDDLQRLPLHCENPHAASDCSPSPVSSSAHSPLNVGLVRPSSASLSDSNDPDSSKVPSSGPQRSKSINGVGAKWEREKRKRSRVTPEQLIHLERFFSMDRSPTAARRKEISDLLGMQERQTQIWFQNRFVNSLWRTSTADNGPSDAQRQNYKMARRVAQTALKPHRIPPQNWRPDMKQSYIASYMKTNVSCQTIGTWFLYSCCLCYQP